MQKLRAQIFCLFIILSCIAEAKNKDEEGMFAKKNKVSSKLSRKLQGNDAFFEYNNGQFATNILYRFSSSTATVDFYDHKVVFGLRKVKRAFNPAQLDEPITFDYISWQIELNPSKNVEISARSEFNKSNVSYFSKNGKHIPQQLTDGIVYSDIYPNIDLVFYKTEKGELKYDFQLHIGALISDISLVYSGVDGMCVADDGSLTFTTSWGDITEDKPYSYWTTSREEVDIDYLVKDNRVSFNADFDYVKEELTLDPIYVDWSSYFYGSGINASGVGYGFTWVYDLDVDSDNNLYVAGITNDKFPVISGSYDTSANGLYDAYLCKMTPSGDSIIWFTYLGGSQNDYCFSVAVNEAQEPVVSGFTRSTDFPITAGAYDSVIGTTSGGFVQYFKGYVSKFSRNGDSLLFSTYLGGSASDLIQSIVLDDAGNVYLTGQTRSSDFPTTAGVYQSNFGGSSTSSGWWNGGDAFLTKINATGTGLIFSTYLGGAGDDVAYEVALSPAGDIYVVGKTNSTNFPTTDGSNIFNYTVNGLSDGFICKFNSAGTTLSYSKMMGGSAEDWFEGVYVNERDEAYVAGISRSTNFYTTANAYQRNNAGGADIVVVKMNPGGQNVYFSTYLGGSGDELYSSGFIYNSNVRIAANVREEPIICGISRSNNFPVTNDALRKTNPSNNNLGSGWNSSTTISKLDSRGAALLYGTYYGGSGFEVPGANKLKRQSCYTNILYGGFTSSPDFPTTSGVYKENRNTTNFFWTGFISKFRDSLYTEKIVLNLEDTITECDEVFEILNAKNTGADILWSNGGKRQYEIIRDTGLIWVQATYGCDTVRDSLYIVKEFSPKVPVLPSDSTYCNTFPSLTLDAKNDTILASYLWNIGDTTQTIVADTAMQFWVDIITPNCGTKRDVVDYKLLLKPNPMLPPDSLFCDSTRLVLNAETRAENEEIYRWNTGDSSATYLLTDTGFFKVVVSNYCGVDSSEFVASKILSPRISLPLDSQFCTNVDIYLAYGIPNNQEFYTYEKLGFQDVIFVVSDTLHITDSGSYEIAISNSCSMVKDTFTASLISTPRAAIGSDTILCDKVELALSAGAMNNDELYTWSNGAVLNSILATEEGLYSVEITNKCGTSKDSIEIQKVVSPTVKLPEDSVFCNNIDFTVDATIEEPSTYLWNTGVTRPIIEIDKAGTYILTVSNFCGTVSDSVVIGLNTNPNINLGDDKIFCSAVQPTTLSTGNTGNDESYLWSNGSVQNTIQLTTEGQYWVRVWNKCSAASDTINLIVSPNPEIDLGSDTTLCGNFSLTLDAGNEGMKYLWMPYGESTQTIQAREQIEYKVTVYNEYGCESTAQFEIRSDCVSKSFIPTAFSPNGDGINDVFKPTLINFEDYQLEVYNRWGEKIFESDDVNLGWDGTYKSEQMQNGVYLFKMRYKTTEDMNWQNVDGLLNLLR